MSQQELDLDRKAETEAVNLPAKRPEKAVARQPVTDSSDFANLLDSSKFEHLWRVATAFSKSDLVPDQFKGKPENVLIGLQSAFRARVDPFMFLQNCYVVAGRPGIETKLALAMLASSGRVVGKPSYRFEGDGKSIQCTASVIDAATGEVVEHTLDWATVEKEGWTQKRGSKWLTDPKLMFCYRSLMRLIRLHYPEVLLGMYTRDELEDIEGSVVSRRVTDRKESADDDLEARLLSDASP